MDLSPYLETVRQGVTNAASLGDDATRQVAERLGGAIESTTRLALIRALSDAVAQVSAEVAPTSVELRMSGADPELVVVVPAPSAEPTLLLPDHQAADQEAIGDVRPDDRAAETAESETTEPDSAGPLGADDEPLARISLRLPASVKAKVDEKADRDGISTNAWLLRAVMDALDERPLPPAPAPPSPPPFPGGSGPFGPFGVFGPNGPFGPDGLFGGRGGHHDAPGGSSRRGTVQGWVR